MDDNLLFSIHEKHLDSGLRGYPVGYCLTSRVDPDKGVFYRGNYIKDVYDRRVEEIFYLIIEGKLPTEEELGVFKQHLASRSALDEEYKKQLEALPKKGHPMKNFAIAILLLGNSIATGKIVEDFLNIQAKLPDICAILINNSENWGETPLSKPELGYAENFCQMLLCPTVKDREAFEHLMKIFLNVHMDHGGGNLSMFVAKAVASGHEDLFGAYASAILALSGPRHGKANQNNLEFVKTIHKDLGDSPSGSQVEDYVKDILADKGVIYGFGHAVLRCEDPRATIFFDFGKKYCKDHPYVDIAIKLNERVPNILKQNPKIQNPYSNMDAISGALLSALGFDFPNYFTVLFALSRFTGIGRQLVYETLEAREGRGVPIYRPKYIYKEAA